LSKKQDDAAFGKSDNEQRKYPRSKDQLDHPC